MNIRGVGRTALLGSALLITLAIGSSIWLIASDQRRHYNEELTTQLLTTARLLRTSLGDGLANDDLSSVAEAVHLVDQDGTIVIIATAHDTTLVNTSEKSDLTDGLLDHPETRRALLVGWGEDTRILPGDSHESRIVAVRAGSDDSVLGVVWLARPTWDFRAAWHSLGRLIAAIGALALVTTLALATALMYLRSRLLRRLTDTARSLSAGDLAAESDIAGSDEFAALAAALNQMRQRLATQVETIDRQRLTLESLVQQLGEGIVVTRPDGRVALINPAALHLLNPPLAARGRPEQWVGAPLERCVPQHSLQRMLRREPDPDDTTSDESPTGSGDQEGNVTVETDTGSVQVLVRASDVLLPDVGPAGEEPARGRMLVLTDITELTHIIRMKTDFVANASHELRTPLTAIRAAIETLLQMDPAEDWKATRHFLGAVDRQGRRLEALVADLLDLSRLESPAARFVPESLRVQEEFDNLQARFAERLEAKHLNWESSVPGATTTRVTANAHLLRLVLDNLVDNAIKFTPEGGRVRASCLELPTETVLEVADSGCGIPDADQPRVFERFYQVERARSGGQERGTGLGLSIVRHAVAAMGGTVTLKSKLGEGTTVSVRVPRRTSA